VERSSESALGLLSDGLGLYRLHFSAFFGPVAMIYLPYYIVLSLLRNLPPGPAIVWMGTLGTLAQALATASVVWTTAQVREGKQIGIGEALGAISVGVVGRLLGALVPALFLITLGIMIFVVPGLIFLVWFALAGQVAVLEGRTFWSALRRSRELVKGRGWRVFYLLILFICLNFLLVALPLTLLPRFAAPLGQVLGLLFLPYPLIVMTLLYLRAREEL